MKVLFWCVFVLQTFLILVDEFYFHWRRNLPRWERVGHPVDTVFYLMPLSILSFCSPSAGWQITYILISVVSSLVITKDEWVHREKSSALEQWLHSLLFLVHPVVLIAAFFVWEGSSAPFLWIWVGVLIFCFYQIIFWNFYADRVLKPRFGNY